MESASTITSFIVQVALGDLPHGSIGYQTIFAAGLALMLLTLCFNLAGYFLRKKYPRGLLMSYRHESRKDCRPSAPSSQSQPLRPCSSGRSACWPCRAPSSCWPRSSWTWH